MSRTALSLVGNRYGRALVIALATIERKPGDRRTFFTCRCDCGTEFVAAGSVLKYGGVKSCGCLRRQQSAKNALGGLAKGRETQAKRRRETNEPAIGRATVDGAVSRVAHVPVPIWRGAEEVARDLAAALGLLGAPA